VNPQAPRQFALGDVVNGHVLTAQGWVPTGVNPQAPRQFALGDVVNGHVLTAQGWVPVGPPRMMRVGGPTPRGVQVKPWVMVPLAVVVVMVVWSFSSSSNHQEQAGAANGVGTSYEVDGDAPLMTVDNRVREAGASASWLTHITGVEQGAALDLNDIYVSTDLREDSPSEVTTALAICQAYAAASAPETRIVVQGYRLQEQKEMDGSTSTERDRAGLARQIGGEPCHEI